MAKKVTVPKLGMGTAPITLVEWCAKEGEWVEKGKVVLIVETEKIRHDVPAKAAGFLHILIKEGSDAPISSAAALLAETKEELATLQKEEPSAATVSSQKPAETSRTAPTVETKVRREGRVIISPAARKLSEEHVIDLSFVVLIASVIGSRFFYVIYHLDEFSNNLLNMVNHDRNAIHPLHRILRISLYRESRLFSSPRSV